MLAGAALAAGLAGVLTFVFGRRIAGAVGSLVRIARALERNDPVEPLRTGVTEVNVLAEQLRAAADLGPGARATRPRYGSGRRAPWPRWPTR